MLKRRATCRFLALIAMLVVALPAYAQREPRMPNGAGQRVERVEIAEAQVLEDKLGQAGALLEGRQVLLPAVFRFGARRGLAVAAGRRTGVNGAIRVNLSTVRAFQGQELFIYGLPVPFDEAHEPMRQLVGRLFIQGDGTQDAPVATVQLDSAMLPLGSVNDYHLFTTDFGDNLLSVEPTPGEVEAAADALAGGFSVPSLVADSSIDAVVRSTTTAQLATKCSWTCTGFPVGGCSCYWSTVEEQWVCGKKKSIATSTCLGWCPG